MTAEVAEPSDGDTLKVTLKRLGELARVLFNRIGSTWIVPRLNREEQRDVRRGATDRSLDAQARREDILATSRDTSIARTQTEDIVKGRRVAQRTRVITPVSNGLHPQRDCNGRPSAGTAGRACLIVGVLRGAVDVV